jgi:large subunit ribosomal protein L11
MPPKKKVAAVVRIQQPGGNANIAKVGQVLGAHGVNIVQVMREFNEVTEKHAGLNVAADITIYEDRSTELHAHTPTTTSLIKRALKIDKGSERPGTQTAGTISEATLREVAQEKMPDLNTASVDEAMKIVAGTARSMGLTVTA